MWAKKLPLTKEHIIAVHQVIMQGYVRDENNNLIPPPAGMADHWEEEVPAPAAAGVWGAGLLVGAQQQINAVQDHLVGMDANGHWIVNNGGGN
jgi:hypothetical protein